MGYDFRASHIHGPSLSALSKALLDAQAHSSDGADYTEKMQEAFKTDGVGILLHDPVVELPRIGFAMPEGELLVSLKARLPSGGTDAAPALSSAYRLAVTHPHDGSAPPVILRSRAGI